MDTQNLEMSYTKELGSLNEHTFDKQQQGHL
jgi:hypothetical protein